MTEPSLVFCKIFIIFNQSRDQLRFDSADNQASFLKKLL